MGIGQMGRVVLLAIAFVASALSFTPAPQSLVRSRYCAFKPLQVTASTKQKENNTFSRIVLYDGVCRFCNSWVNLVLRLDRRGTIKFAALQSEVGQSILRRCGRETDDISSVVYCKDGNCFVKSEAVVQVASDIGIPLRLFSWMAPLSLKDAMYDAVANNRYRLMGKLESCRISDDNFDHRFLS